jgi:hypothetical protein
MDPDCSDRDFLEANKYIRKKIASFDNKNLVDIKFGKNCEEEKYEKRSYNGSFHKGFKHNSVTGELANVHEYNKYLEALLNNNQKKLAKVKLAKKFQIGLANPLASMSSVLVGAPQMKFDFPQPSSLSSKEHAADMVELYCQMLCRDIPFTQYDPNVSNTIKEVLIYMNQPEFLNHFEYSFPKGSITTGNIFRGIAPGEHHGPYISQLLLLNFPLNGVSIPQKYATLPTKMDAINNSITCEWGRNMKEMINIQNTTISNLPPIPKNFIEHKYIYSGRVLAASVQMDYVYNLQMQAALILNALGAKMNPGWPVYKNQTSFITGANITSILTAIGEVSQYALKHAWFWKWQVYRKLRPECTSMWIDNVKNKRVKNKHNYNISKVVLKNPVMEAVKEYNAEWGTEFDKSYTLDQVYQSGCPTHPTYPAGHAVIAGAISTVLKIYFDAEQPWSSLPGLQIGSQNRAILPTPLNGPVIQADDTGDNLIDYFGNGINSMTIAGEINKLASNISIGRDWAGVHQREDGITGMFLGEAIAIDYMEDILSAQVENNLDGSVPTISFRKFDGKLATINPSICKK